MGGLRTFVKLDMMFLVTLHLHAKGSMIEKILASRHLLLAPGPAIIASDSLSFQMDFELARL